MGGVYKKKKRKQIGMATSLLLFLYAKLMICDHLQIRKHLKDNKICMILASNV